MNRKRGAGADEESVESVLEWRILDLINKRKRSFVGSFLCFIFQ